MNKEQNVESLNVSPAIAKPMLPAVLPCPFCGCEAKAVHHHYKANYQGMRTSFTGLFHMDARTLWTVRCTNYDCPVKPFTSLEDDKENAISRWNTRPNGG